MVNKSEIEKIRNRYLRSEYPKLVTSLSIRGVHGLKDVELAFNFPICAIVGENGTGKSTILKILSCAYSDPDKNGGSFYPSSFFPDTKWDKLSKVYIEYQIKQGLKIISHTISKPTARWRFNKRPENKVYFFDLSRIQPFESIIGTSKLANKKIKELSSEDISEEGLSRLCEVMGREYGGGRYVSTDADKNKKMGILKFPFGEISQFHQGTGESVISDFIFAIEKIPDYSLVVIDEIESSLHPKAQRRLISQLLGLTRSKKLQIVFSTHSPYILNEIPSEARILLTRTGEKIEPIYSPSVEFCLSHIDDEMHHELEVLVEDKRSAVVVEELLRNYDPTLLKRIRVLKVGQASIIKMISDLVNQGEFPYNVVGIVDADQDMKDILKLPGKYSPEKQVISDLVQSNTIQKLSPILNTQETNIQSIFSEVMTNREPKKWVGQLAYQFRISNETLWHNLVTIWAKNCVNDSKVSDIIRNIEDRLEIRS